MFVGADHIIEVRVVRANMLITQVLTASADRQSVSEDVVRPQILSDTTILRCAHPAIGPRALGPLVFSGPDDGLGGCRRRLVNYKVIAARGGRGVEAIVGHGCSVKQERKKGGQMPNEILPRNRECNETQLAAIRELMLAAATRGE